LGNLYLGGHFNPIPLNGGGPLVSFNDGPALTLGSPFFMSLTSAGKYRYGSSLVGYSNWLSDVAIANDGTAWYAGYQQGALAVGSLLSPDPGQGGLLLRVSSKGTVDKLRSYPYGLFLAVDVDGQGRPVVAGKFRGGVDLGAGTITVGNPSVVVAKLNP